MPTLLPVKIEQSLRVHVSRLTPPIEPGRTRYELAAADAPSDEVRGVLASRHADIDRWMAPAGPETATEQYLILNGSMAHADRDAAAAALHTTNWVRDTMDLPMFAMIEACSAARRGFIGDGKWMPEAGVICIEARRRAQALGKERRDIEAVLTAEIRTAPSNSEVKARNLADAAEFVAGSLAMEKASRRGRMSPAELADAQAIAAMLRDGTPDPRPMPMLSPALRRSMRLPEPPPSRADEQAA